MVKQLFRRELLDVKGNEKDYRFALEILKGSIKGSGPFVDMIDYLYYQEFGPSEEFERAKKVMEERYGINK